MLALHIPCTGYRTDIVLGSKPYICKIRDCYENPQVPYCHPQQGASPAHLCLFSTVLALGCDLARVCQLCRLVQRSNFKPLTQTLVLLRTCTKVHTLSLTVLDRAEFLACARTIAERVEEWTHPQTWTPMSWNLCS